jgi:DNA-binding NarL/FixJ family response regulator
METPASALRTFTRVAVVEDDPTVREAICACCTREPDLACIFSFGSAEELLSNLSPRSAPDVILMDIGLPGMSGIGAMKIIRERFPDIDIIVLTVYHDPHRIFQSLCAGASGYLLKTTPFPEIRRAIELVRNGGAPMSPQIARKVVDYFRSEEDVHGPSALTPRERQVVLSLVEGMSYKMIAGCMNVSLETVRSHIKSIYRKLHVHGKAEVISRALRGEI